VSDLILRVKLLEEQLIRHEAEITTCLSARRPVPDAGSLPRVDRLERELSRIEGIVKSEQLYRQGQQLLFGERDFEKSASEGLLRLKQSAKLGNSTAMLACGLHLEAGKVSDPDLAQAGNYFRLAAAAGSSSGQFRLGRCLETGSGVGKNEGEAVQLYKLAADQGNSSAQNSYGFCLQHGIGIAKDEREAVRYYRLSAEQRNGAGQYNYGLCLLDDVGTAANRASAERYFALARAQGVGH
jgi:TPR repeat protein